MLRLRYASLNSLSRVWACPKQASAVAHTDSADSVFSSVEVVEDDDEDEDEDEDWDEDEDGDGDADADGDADPIADPDADVDADLEGPQDNIVL